MGNCSVLLPGCLMELELCCLPRTEVCWNKTQRLLLIGSEAARGTYPTLVGFSFAWKANSLLQHGWKFVKMQLHNLC